MKLRARCERELWIVIYSTRHFANCIRNWNSFNLSKWCGLAVMLVLAPNKVKREKKLFLNDVVVARRGRPAPYPLHHSTSKQPKPASARYAITIERCGAGSHACYQHCVTHSKISPTFSRSASVHTPFSFLYTTCALLRQRVSAKKYCGVRSFSTNGNEHDLKKKRKKKPSLPTVASAWQRCVTKNNLIHILDGTRTRNLRLRRPTPCPLGHEDVVVDITA